MLAPTRELAVQIEDQVQGLDLPHAGVERRRLRRRRRWSRRSARSRAGVDIIVATPGRLMDHMRHESIDFDGLEILVLDEADRMLDMGFWPDVQPHPRRACRRSGRRCCSRPRCRTK